jgi:hypothetical protein
MLPVIRSRIREALADLLVLVEALLSLSQVKRGVIQMIFGVLRNGESQVQIQWP